MLLVYPSVALSMKPRWDLYLVFMWYHCPLEQESFCGCVEWVGAVPGMSASLVLTSSRCQIWGKWLQKSRSRRLEWWSGFCLVGQNRWWVIVIVLVWLVSTQTYPSGYDIWNYNVATEGFLDLNDNLIADRIMKTWELGTYRDSRCDECCVACRRWRAARVFGSELS